MNTNYRSRYLIVVSGATELSLTRFEDLLRSYSRVPITQIIVFEDTTTSEAWIYFKAIGESKGFSRKFFDGQAAGLQYLQQCKLGLVSIIDQRLINDKLKYAALSSDFKPHNQEAEQFVSDIQNQHESEPPLEIKGLGLASKIKINFIQALQNKDTISTENFVRDFLESGQMHEYAVANEIMSVLKKMEQNHYRLTNACKIEIPLLTSVIDIIETNHLSNEQWAQCYKTITSSFLLPALWALYKILIWQGSQKRKTVWIHGMANSGKSFIVDEVKKIFNCEIFHDGAGYFAPETQRNPEKTQLVCIDEANIAKLFAATSLSQTKKLFEGRGYNLEVKFQNPALAYEGAFVLLTSNVLPVEIQEVLDPTRDDNRGSYHTYSNFNSSALQEVGFPFVERCEFVHHKHRFDSERDNPSYGYVEMCYLWAAWHIIYKDCNPLPKVPLYEDDVDICMDPIEIRKLINLCIPINKKP